MSQEVAATIVRRVYDEVLNEGNLDVADELIALHAVDHADVKLSSLPVSNPNGVKDFVRSFCAAFPDAYWTVESMAVDRDTVKVHTTVSGSHHDEYLDMRPGGREFTIKVMDTLRIAGGKIVEHWGELDVPSMRHQLTF